MNPRQGGSMGDELTNAALIALIGAFGLALVLRGAGSIAAFLSGTPEPETGPASGLGVLFSPADPAGVLDAPGLSRLLDRRSHTARRADRHGDMGLVSAAPTQSQNRH